MIVTFFFLVCCFATQALKMAGKMSSAFMEAGIPLSNLLIVCVMSVVTLKFTFSTLFMNLYSTDSEKKIFAEQF